jgi:ribonuclease P protein component
MTAPGRIVKAADFQRMLAAPLRQRSAHFALHHLRARPLAKRLANKLSTEVAPACAEPVDELPGGIWLGCIVPKRHARRAVTRSMLKRQMRASLERSLPGLAQGLWLLRLRQPFVTQQYPSADSPALRHAVREELDRLLARAAAPEPSKP